MNGLDLSKEALWVSVGQRASDLWAVKVGGQKKFCQSAWFELASPAMGQKDITKNAWPRRKEGHDAKSLGVWINFTTARLGRHPIYKDEVCQDA